MTYDENTLEAMAHDLAHADYKAQTEQAQDWLLLHARDYILAIAKGGTYQMRAAWNMERDCIDYIAATMPEARVIAALGEQEAV